MLRCLLKFGIIILLVLGLSTPGSGKSKHFFNKPSLGVSMGSWKPAYLSDNPTVSIIPANETSPFWELFFISPWVKSFAARVSLGYWEQRDLAKPEVSSVLILPLSLEMKYQLLPQARLSPFASYGLTFYYGAENPRENFPKRIAEAAELAIGFNVGAGLDYAISRRWAIGSEFQYLYARMPHQVGQTDDYSGPKISFKIFYLF